MSTLTGNSLRPSTGLRVRRYATVLFLILALAVLGVSGYSYRLACAALPQLDGELKVAGLVAKVTVIRDEHGVPTIEATSLEDLFLAQGYVTAQDRLWQMDHVRRLAAGEVSEVQGEGHLELDREQRILGFRSVARHSLESTTPRDRSYLEAYARGVNRYIESHRESLPIEFRLLHYAPKPWTAEDSLLVAACLVQSLNHGPYKMALLREKVLALFGPETTAELFVNSSPHDRLPTQAPPLPDQSFEIRDADDALSRQPEELPRFLPGPPDFSATARDLFVPTPGSNNWVVSGAHTVSGKPLLSTDIHLKHQMPNFWYEAHLHSGNFDVAGITLPGMPFVVVGHNQRIAWAFTNLNPTVEDLYVETFNPQGQYLTPQGWREPDHRRQVIHVKGKPDTVVDVVVTRHGPVITDLIPGERRQLALRWTLYDGIHSSLFALDSSQNWDEFLRALSTWDAFSQNAVFADIDGHIGYHATGHIPIRAAGDGSLPENGSDQAHEWTGYIPFNQLPGIFDPPWGILATAGGRITPNAYPYSITTGWEAPWRTQRIYKVLESGQKLTPADMLSLQTDVYSAFDHFCAKRFVQALDHAGKLSPRARQARDLMRSWNGKVTTDSAAATIEFHATWRLLRMLLEPMLQAAQKDARPGAPTLTFVDLHWSMTTVWLENVLLKQPRHWLPGDYPDYDALLAAAVETAVHAPEAPGNLLDWKWGAGSLIDIQNPILGQLPVIRRWTGPGRVPQAGHGLTVDQIGPNFGPSQRLTVDLADLDRTTLNLVTGQSGNFLSPYYTDQWKAWCEGFTFALPFSPAAVAGTKAHTLVLYPGA